MNRIGNRMARQDWATPPKLFRELDSEFGFTLDVCANSGNAKCEQYILAKKDALTIPWGENVCFMNPPFGRGKSLEKWIRKAYEESLRGATVVCLVPSSPCTYWWHDYAMKGEIRFIRGRVRFVGAAYNAPFPCSIVIFRPPT